MKPFYIIQKFPSITNHLPTALLADGVQQKTPPRKSKEPKIKTSNMIIAYPSRTPTIKGGGTGGFGGATGHDASQSKQAQAVPFCNFIVVEYFTVETLKNNKYVFLLH